MAPHGTWRSFAVGSVLLGACSVVNSFDEVAPRTSDDEGGAAPTGGTNTGGTTGGTGNSAGASGADPSGGVPSSAGSGGDPGGGGDTPNPSGGAAGSDGGSAGETGTVRPLPDRGLIVLGGTDLERKVGLLSVLNAVTGEELDREELSSGATVTGIAYDGAAGKDVWFVFVGSNFPAPEDKALNLQVRYFNDRTNNWIVLSRVTTLPPPVPGSFAVLNDRIAYLSHTVDGGKVRPSLTILDTSDVRDVKAVTFDEPTVEGDMVLLLGTRGTADDRAGLGGTLDLALAQNCAGGVCDLFVQPIAVGSTVTNGVGHVIGSYRGTPVGAASTRQLNDYFAYAPETGSVVVSRIVPDAPESPVTSNAPPMATDLSALALAECQQVVLFTAYAENALYGVTSAGIGRTLALGRPGQLVAYEPFTRDAITTYNPPNDDFLTAAGGAGGAGGADSGPPGPDIDAVRVASPSSASLSLALRTGAGWTPPTDLRVNVLATRIPYPLECP